MGGLGFRVQGSGFRVKEKGSWGLVIQGLREKGGVGGGGRGKGRGHCLRVLDVVLGLHAMPGRGS